MTQLVFMLYFLFFRIIESKALEVLTGSKDTRYRLVAKAEESRYIKRIVIKKRSDRTTHAITIFLLTKARRRKFRVKFSVPLNMTSETRGHAGNFYFKNSADRVAA